MTSPHIEAIARYMEPEAFEAWDRAKASFLASGHDENAAALRADLAFGKEVRRAIHKATLAFTMIAEICAKETRECITESVHHDWDLGWNAGIETADASIRALIPKEVG